MIHRRIGAFSGGNGPLWVPMLRMINAAEGDGSTPSLSSRAP